MPFPMYVTYAIVDLQEGDKLEDKEYCITIIRHCVGQVPI